MSETDSSSAATLGSSLPAPLSSAATSPEVFPHIILNFKGKQRIERSRSRAGDGHPAPEAPDGPHGGGYQQRRYPSPRRLLQNAQKFCQESEEGLDLQLGPQRFWVSPLRFHLIYSTDPKAQRKKRIKGIQKRMAKLDGDIQLAKIRFATKGDAQGGGISSQDACLLGFFCWMLTHPAEKSAKV
ncbi:hypothetical protein BZA77DRAFT_359434 [Pyronema omphalodes]|nr:hypothetical protein BZA77DRAFT_359434 [Pyronema omphalodes]